jgi:hypothetical protein
MNAVTLEGLESRDLPHLVPEAAAGLEAFEGDGVHDRRPSSARIANIASRSP